MSNQKQAETLEMPGGAYGASDHYSGDKGASYFEWQSGGGAFAALINRRKFAAHIRPTDTVIDFGCGGGFLLNSIACARRIGVEINPIARAHTSRFYECYSDTMEVADCTADVIVSDHALEHVPFPIAALKEIRRILKPGGRLVLVTPIDSVRRHRHYDPSDIHHHLHHWTPQHMGNTLTEAGLRVESIRSRIYAWPGRWTVACYGRLPYWLFRAITWGYGRLTGKGRELIAVATR
jgi:SAM-dependent methyltransferase